MRTSLTLREQNVKDLRTLLGEIAKKVNENWDTLDDCTTDLTDFQVADLVDKAGHLVEWMGWA